MALKWLCTHGPPELDRKGEHGGTGMGDEPRNRRWTSDFAGKPIGTPFSASLAEDLFARTSASLRG